MKQGGVKLVLADKNDPDGAGFVQSAPQLLARSAQARVFLASPYLRWRAGFYVAGVDGAVKKIIMLLDDFYVWKMKALQKEVEVPLALLPLSPP